MLTRSPSLGSVVVVVAFVLAALGLSLFVWNQFGGTTPLEPQGYRVVINFPQAQNLLPNADVRISGVTIGKVISVTPGAAATRSVVEIDPRYVPLHDDVRATVRVKTLLGESFVALTPGSATAPAIRSGGALPAADVARPQLLDEVLSAFDARTRKQFTDLLQSAATALDGRGADFNDALGHLGPTADQLDQLVTLLNAQGHDLASLVSGSATTFDAVSRRPADLQGLVRSARTLLHATSRSRSSLRATIGALPGLEQELRLTSLEVGATAATASPTIRALLPVSGQLAPALRDGTSLALQTRALVLRLRPTLRLALRGLEPGRRVLHVLPPLLAQLYASGRDLVPLVDLLGAFKHEIVGGLADYGAAGEATAPDASGVPHHYIRGLNVVNNEVYQLYAKRPGTNRHNAYPPPGWLGELAGGLHSADCQNAGNATPPPDAASAIPSVAKLIPALGGAPPCVTEKPWRFDGNVRSYPHLVRAP